MPKRILIVDDNPEMRTMLKLYLTQEGFDTLFAVNGQEALFTARQEKPDLILLDIMMPEMGGYDFLRAYRRTSDTPIIFLTARVEDNDIVLGLELGADDYITKPFSLRQLTARIRVVLRRQDQPHTVPDMLRLGEVELDRNGRTVIISGRSLDLTPSEFDLLDALMSAPGRVFSRLELLDRLQGTAYEGYERTIDVHVRNLRAKIELDPSQPHFIETVYGAGYRFAVQG